MPHYLFTSAAGDVVIRAADALDAICTRLHQSGVLGSILAMWAPDESIKLPPRPADSEQPWPESVRRIVGTWQAKSPHPLAAPAELKPRDPRLPLPGIAVGLIVAAARKLRTLAVEHGVGFTISVDPHFTSIMFVSGPRPDMPDAQRIPMSDHTALEIDGVRLTWRGQ